MILTSTVLECLLSSFTTSSRLVLCEAIIFLCIVVKFLPNSFCILTTSLPTSLKDETAMALNRTQLPSIMFAQLAQNVNTIQKIIYKIPPPSRVQRKFEFLQATLIKIANIDN